MDNLTSHSGLSIEGRIDILQHDVDDLREAVPEWDDLDKKAKKLVTLPPEGIDLGDVDEDYHDYALLEVEPTDEEHTHNVTCVGLHEYIVDNLDPAQTAVKDNVTAAYLGLGTDGTTTPASGDTDLNTRVYSETVTDHADNGASILCSTFVDSTEGNGNTFAELGLYSGDPANLANADVFLLNHSTFSGVTKDNSKTVTFDVTLSFSAA